MNIQSQKSRSYIWLVMGAVLMYFSNWNWAVPAFTWLFSVFLLRFTRTQTPGKGLSLLCLSSMAVGMLSMVRLLAIDAIPLWFRIISGLLVGVMFLLAFIVDRLFVYKIPGVAATLIFPCAWTACEYIKSSCGGSWGSLAYTQYGNPPFIQLVSITGIWGISFLITWFASIVNFAWEHQFTWKKISKIVTVYGLIIVFIFLYGFSRLATTDNSSDKVCIAAITNPEEFMTRFYKPDWKDRKSAYKKMKADLNFFINESRLSAGTGAGIVLWQEYAVSVMHEHEHEFIEHAIELATTEHIYLAIAIAVFPLSYPDQPWQNKLIWIDPSGRVISEYLKSKPAPPLEPIVPGKGDIPILDTPYGKIASVICADLDYPGLLYQAGVYDADLLLIPAQDWAAVDPLHTNMSIFRAIENGVSMVKCTGGGLSISVDPYGRIVKSSDYYNPGREQMISCLPAKGVKTIYSTIGDAFARGCVLGSVIISIWGFFLKRRT